MPSWCSEYPCTIHTQCYNNKILPQEFCTIVEGIQTINTHTHAHTNTELEGHVPVYHHVHSKNYCYVKKSIWHWWTYHASLNLMTFASCHSSTHTHTISLLWIHSLNKLPCSLSPSLSVSLTDCSRASPFSLVKTRPLMEQRKLCSGSYWFLRISWSPTCTDSLTAYPEWLPDALVVSLTR